MKIKELAYLFKLPKELRKLLCHYLVKKTLGRSMTNEEVESNKVLRVLSNSRFKLKKITDEEIVWQIKSQKQTYEVVTRRFPSSDIGILHQVFNKEEYKPALDLMTSLEDKSSLRIVDAGANVGFFSMFSKLNLPHAEIIMLEIDRSNAIQIHKNIRLNNLTGIKIYENALWKTNTNLLIKNDFRDGSQCTFYVEETNEPTPLMGYELGYFLKLNGWDKVDILKVDIEGAERYIFESDELADSVLQLVTILAIEIHDEFQIRDSIYRHFERNRFTYFEHGDITIAYKD